MKRIQIRRNWVVTICVCLGILYIITGGSPMSQMKKLIFRDSSECVGLEDVVYKWSIPSKNCSGLVDDWSKYNMSEEYYRLLPYFTSRLKEATKDALEEEGHSGQLLTLTRILHYLASSASVKVVCETGFNYGHSSFNFLTANKNIKVHSFDLGVHDYAKKMADVLKDMFKDRIEVHFGDSTKIVPENKANGVLPLCDLIFVDGGHNCPVAMADLLNFGTHSNPENVVIFDDYPTDWGTSFGKAWEALLVRGEDRVKVKPLDAKSMKDKSPEALNQLLGIVEQMRCTEDSIGIERAFTFGKYVSKGGSPMSQMKKLIFRDSESVGFKEVISKLRIPSKNCSGLVDDWSKYNMSEEYYRLLPSFTSRLKEATKNAPEEEGHSGQLLAMTRILHYLASSASVKVVCETGFNYGHSSFNFLTANKNIKVHSFDLGVHDYAKKMADVLKDIFKDRIEVHFGDSTKTVPENKANGVLPLCDLIFVDGGHNYPVAKADLLNFGTHSNPENVVIFDDYPTGWGASFGKAWEELLVRGEDRVKVKPLDAKSMKDKSPEALNQLLGIVEQMRCTVDSIGLERAFTFGKYVSRG